MNPLKNYLSSLMGSKTSPFTAAGSTSSISPLNATQSQTQQPQMTMMPTPSTPSAVSPTPTTTSPARSAYTQSIASPTTGALSESQVRANLDSYNAQQQASTASTPSAPASLTTVDTPKNAFLQSYRDYLSQYAKSLEPSSQVRDAASRLADIQNKGEERSLKARRAYEETLDRSGMLKSGAQEAATRGARRDESMLADIALQESAAARALDALTGSQTANQEYYKTLAEMNKPLQIGDNYYDPSTGELIQSAESSAEGFTLSPGQIRFDAEGNVIASGGPREKTDAEITKALERQEKDEAAKATQTSAIGLVSSILSSPDLGQVSGVSRLGIGARIASSAAIRSQLSQLKALTSLAERDKLKGTGPISDFEGKMLADSANALNFAIGDDGRVAMPDADVEQNLKNIRGAMQLKAGLPTQAVVTDPETGESIQATLTSKDAQDLYLQGLLIDFL